MNWRNRYLVVTVRVILGLFMVMSGVSGLLIDPSVASPTPELNAIGKSLMDSGLFQMIKITEIVTGLMLVAGFLPWLALLALAPVTLGVIVFNAKLSPQYLPMVLPLLLFGAFLGWVYWSKYEQLFVRKWEA